MDIKHLINELEEIVYVSDPETYELLFINESGKKLLAIDQDYYGKKCYTLLQGKDAPCEFCTNDCLKKDAFYIWEHTNAHFQRHYILKDKLIDWGDRPARMELAFDITEKENMSNAVCEKLNIEQMLVGCIRQLTSEAGFAEGIHTVLGNIGHFYQADRAYIFEFDYEADTMRNAYEWHCKSKPERTQLQSFSLHLIDPWMEAFRQGKTVRMENLDQCDVAHKKEHEIFCDKGVQNLLVVPLTIHAPVMAQLAKKYGATPFDTPEEQSISQKNFLGFLGVDNPRYIANDSSLLDSLSYFIVNEMMKQRLREQLIHVSYHDGLTGLFNRNRYLQYMKNIQKKNLNSIGVIYIDINGLKSINDLYGHETGDEAIVQVAETLRRLFPQNSIFRIGGDEYLIFCENSERQDFVEHVDRIKTAFEKMKGLNVSIGSTWAENDIHLHELISQADELMYLDKQAYYEHSLKRTDFRGPAHLEKLLCNIERRRFEIYLQPKINIETEQVIGAEALIRYNDPESGVMVPNQFIYYLEQEKMIKYIDLFVFEEVCSYLFQWEQRGYERLPISLNFSRLTMMEPNLVEKLEQIHKRHPCAKERIEIEITESFGQYEKECIISTGAKLRHAGYRLSLDDFGARYASLTMLAAIEVDALKLDRSLIESLADNSKCHTIVNDVIQTCKRMGICSVAEGVETKEQLHALRGMNCDFVQGFYFGRPMPVEMFVQKYLERGETQEA